MNLKTCCHSLLTLFIVVGLLVATGCDMGTYDKRFNEGAGSSSNAQNLP